MLQPQIGQSQEVVEVQSPLQVSGWGSNIASDDLQGVTVALVDAGGGVRLTRFVSPLEAEGQTPPAGLTVTEFSAPFVVDVSFEVTGSLSVCLWVFEQAVGSGQPQNVVQVPLELTP